VGLRTTLFGPAWQNRDPSTRADAVAHMQDQALLAKLPEIAKTDADAKVRHAAQQRITDIATLNHCRLHDSDDDNRQLTTERLVQMLCYIETDNSFTLIKPVADALLSDDQLANKLTESIAENAKHQELRKLALANIHRPGFLGNRVLQENHAELQQQALQQIQQVSTLERLSKTLRKTNKKLYRQAQQQLENLQPQKYGHRLDEDQALQLCQQLEALAKGQAPQTHSSDSTDIKTQLQQIDQAWQLLNNINQTLQQRYANTRAILQQAASGAKPIDTPPEVIPETPPQHDNIATQAEKTLQQLGEKLQQLLANRPKSTELDKWRQNWRSTWSQLDEPTIADQRLQEKLRNQLLKYQQQQTETAEQKAAKQAALEDKINAIEKTTEEGQLVTATSQLQALREQLPAKPQRKIAERLRTIDQQLGELRRWQRWSDNEQRVRLIKTIEKALKDELNPDALLTVISDARSNWQQLEQQEIAHGMRALPKDHSLTRQFHGVSGRAMGQARPFMDNRRKLQQERVELISTLLGNTRELLAKDNIAARELIKHKRILGKLFRELSGLAHKQRKQTADSIRQLMDQISDRLTTSFGETETAKRKLIRQAEQLQHLTDQHEAIQTAKNLQQQWQRVGPTSRKIDQQLWQAFRTYLDPLFENQQRQHAEQKAEQNEQHQQHTQWCEQLEALSNVDEQQLQANTGKVEGIQSQWPEQQVFDKKLLQRFRAAGDKFNQRMEAWKNQQRDQRQQALAATANDLQQATLDWLKSGKQALSETAQQQLGSLLDMSRDELISTLQERDTIARQMCITAEFLSGLPSPSEDRDARMQYQVARLADRMSQRDNQQELSIEVAKLEQQWYANYPLSADQHSLLDSRFHKALTAAQKLSGT